MGSDDIFKKRREERGKRNHGYKQPKANSFLIVTEGERTEPMYLRGIVKLIEDKIGGNVNVVEIPTIDIHGEGCSTYKLIEKADEIVKKSKIIYQNIWLVFDKDDFYDFDKAIEEGLKKDYKIAWSNQSFEYWAYLHYHYIDTALHRDQWCEKLNKIFKKNNLGTGKYKKNYSDIYSMLDMNDGVTTAINNAKRRMSEFDNTKTKPSEFDPGTTMHVLVSELRKYLEE